MQPRCIRKLDRRGFRTGRSNEEVEMEQATLKAVNPVLPTRNVSASIEFYVEKLRSEG